MRLGRLSGSLTRLSDGTSYLIAGSNISITTGSTGAVTITSTTTGGGDSGATYLVLSATGSLTAERIFAVGTGLSSSDGGAGGNYTLIINDSIVATISGSTFTGVTKHSGGLSGSLTKLSDGTSYLIAGNNTTITTSSNGSIIIGSTAVSGAAGNNTQIQFNSGGSLAGDSGLTYVVETESLSAVNLSINATNDQTWSLKDNSASALNIGGGVSNYWTFNTGDNQERLGFWDNVRASFGDINDPDLNIQHDGTNSRIENKTGKLILSSASGLDISGSTKFANGLSGSLTKLIDGTSYIIAGSGISVTTGSSGAITITNDGTIGDITAVNAGTGLTGGGTTGAITLSINDSIVATVSGTTFTGVTKHNSGLSGSLTRLVDGTSYIVAGSGISITTGSSGAITITNDGTVGDITAVNAGTGLIGGGTSGGVTLAINDSVVATVSGTTFAGAINSPGITSTAGLTQSGGNVSLVAQTNGSVSIGNDSGTTVTSILGGTSVILSGAAGTNYTLGGETGTGTITIGQSTQTNTINIGNGAVASSARIQTINVGTNASSFGSAVVSVGSIAGLSNTTIAAAGALILTGSTATSYTIGGQGQTGTMTLGRSTASNTINIGSAGNNVSNTQTINVGSGTGTSAVTIGSTAGASPTIIQAGTTGLSVSGSARFNQGLSGSHTKLTDGTSYLIAGSNVTITTGSNGGVTISSTGGSPGGSDKFVQFNDGGSFNGVSTFQFDKTTNQLTAYQASMTNALTASTLKAGASTISLFNDTATTINFAGAATTILAGGSSVTLGLGGVGATNSTITASTGSFGRVLASSTSTFTGASTHNGGITTTTLTATSNATVAGTFSSTGDITGQGTSNQLNVLSVTGSLGLSVTGPETVTGVLTAQSSSNLGTIIELMSSSNGGTGVVNFSISSSSIFYVNNPAGNITANFTGVPTTTERIISTTVILSQSSTGRIVSAVQIDGASSTINWSNGITPTGNAGKQDVFGFSLIRSGSAWKTLGQMNTFG